MAYATEANMQAALVSCAYFLYAAHVLSVPAWLLACAREFRRQRHMALAGEGRAPNEWEYWGVRVFLMYALADAVRNADAVFEADDGTYRSIWGVGPMALRLFAWWARDAACFTGVAVFLQFTLRWTHVALNRPVPRGLVLGLHVSCAVVVVGLGACFCLVLTTNRMAWVVGSALTVIPLNVLMAVINVGLLRSVFPALQRSAHKVQDKQTSAMISQAWGASCMMLVFNVSFLAVVPMLCIDKVRGGAYSTPLITKKTFDIWIGTASVPPLADLPPNVMPIPIMEVLEIVLGWLNVVACVLASRGYILARGRHILGDFIDCDTLGNDIRRRLGVALEGKKCE